MKALLAYLTILTIFGLVTPAHAVLTLFDSRTAFEAALGPHELITFDEFPIGAVAPCRPTTPFIPDPCVFTTEGITFTGTQGNAPGPPIPGPDQRPLLSIANNIGFEKALFSNVIPIAPDQFFLTFSHPFLGIGFDIKSQGIFPATVPIVDVTETDGSVTEIPISGGIPVSAFFGVTSDIGITKVSLFDPTDPSSANFFIDNIVFPQLKVLIDILTNSINLKSDGVIPAAILSSPTFDAPEEVDPATLTLSGASVKTVSKNNKLLCDADDVNSDGLLDLVCHFVTQQFIDPEGSTVVLEGQTFDGTPIRGEELVNVKTR